MRLLKEKSRNISSLDGPIYLGRELENCLVSGGSLGIAEEPFVSARPPAPACSIPEYSRVYKKCRRNQVEQKEPLDSARPPACPSRIFQIILEHVEWVRRSRELLDSARPPASPSRIFQIITESVDWIRRSREPLDSAHPPASPSRIFQIIPESVDWISWSRDPWVYSLLAHHPCNNCMQHSRIFQIILESVDWISWNREPWVSQEMNECVYEWKL
jgi:hypothetical protein